MREILIVACTVKKIWHDEPGLGAVPARDAYRYEAFAAWRKRAERSDRWLIFSTQYGLIAPETLIERYDRSAWDARRDAAFRHMVQQQAGALGFADAESILMVGEENKAMVSLLRDLLPKFAGRIRLIPA